MPAFAGWENFYVILGSSAGALIGLQFVAMTLVAERLVVRYPGQAGAFATPTIVHFCAVLLLAGILSAPWAAAMEAVWLWTLAGLGGLAYELMVVRRMRRGSYHPVFEDWLCHTALPLLAYAMLVGAGMAAGRALRGALFGVGAAALLLLFVGIHNAWDSVVYHVIVQPSRAGGQGAPDPTL